MADARFYQCKGPFALGELASTLGGTLSEGADGGILIHDVASLDDAAAGRLVFLANARNLGLADGKTYGAIIVAPDLAASVGIAILHPDPARAFAMAAAAFYPGAGRPSGQQTAIHPDARIADTASLGAGAIVGAGAEIGAGTHIGAYAVVGPGVCIGRDCYVGNHASIEYALIGDRVVIHAGVRLGTDGFGFASGAAGHLRIPQLGRAIIQDDVEIGANSTIDRGAMGDTVIGEGAKIDNMVHVAHNCVIGRHVILAAQVGVAGSTTIGDWTVMGGQVGVADHVTVGPGARIAAKSGITKDLAGRADYGGYPARPAMQWRREMAALRRLTRGTKRRDE